MPEPFKNNFSLHLVTSLAKMLSAKIPEFDKDGFEVFIYDHFSQLELKQRSSRIAEGLSIYMPEDLSVCARVIEEILHPEDVSNFNQNTLEHNKLAGWMIMPVADFVSRRWIASDFKGGMNLLKKLTRRFSAEFAIRAFIIADTEKAMDCILEWSKDANEHVRRLASEGTRPRLPWGQQLPVYIDDPVPLTAIFENLMDDGSEYVRRSVANNLNDIAKDNPGFVIDFVRTNLSDASKERVRLFKHACRSLFKQGDPDTLALFGYQPFQGQIQITQITKEVTWGGKLEFGIHIEAGISKPQNLMVDFVIWHLKANGKLTPKVFKWKVIEAFVDKSMHLKSHSFKEVTTRKYYPGEHRLEIQINGQIQVAESFLLTEKCL